MSMMLMIVCGVIGAVSGCRVLGAILSVDGALMKALYPDRRVPSEADNRRAERIITLRDEYIAANPHITKKKSTKHIKPPHPSLRWYRDSDESNEAIMFLVQVCCVLRARLLPHSWRHRSASSETVVRKAAVQIFKEIGMRAIHSMHYIEGVTAVYFMPTAEDIERLSLQHTTL
jgi:hypothetical protein